MIVKYNEPLSRHTSFCVGGPARYWIEPENPEDILEAISLAESKNKKFIIMGKGTNLLVKDEGFDGAIIHLDKGFKKAEKEGETIIKAGAGLSLGKLVGYALDNSLSGCEFLTGIPGNIGGSIYMNAGVRNPEDRAEYIEIKDIILDIIVLDLEDKKIKALDKKEIDFKYRYSGLDRKIILNARFELKKDKKENIQDRIKTFNKKRDWLIRIDFPNAGSIFKNPSLDKSAGMLIESCGLKGKRIGNAEISSVHANIIVNRGKASAKDVLGLIDFARESVKQKFGIDLEIELKIL